MSMTSAQAALISTASEKVYLMHLHGRKRVFGLSEIGNGLYETTVSGIVTDITVDGESFIKAEGAYGDGTWWYDAATNKLSLRRGVTILANPSPATNDYFASSVSISADGTIAAVGVYNDDTGYTDSGIVYIFNAITGVVLQTIVNPNVGFNGSAAAVDRFGYKVALSGDGSRVAISAYQRDMLPNYDVGWVYTYNTSTGELLAAMGPPVADQSMYSMEFGGALAMSYDGSTVAVAAMGYSAAAPNYYIGIAYTYDAELGGLPTGRFVNPTPVAYELMGFSIAADTTGSWIAVGCPFDTNEYSPPNTYGAVYVFQGGSMSPTHTVLKDPSPTANGNFGQSVAFSGDGSRVIVGCPSSSADSPSRGRAYVFTRSSGALVQAISNPSQIQADSFGYAVSLNYDGSVAAVSAPYKNVSGAGTTGRVYVFQVGTATPIYTHDNPVPVVGDMFGYHIKLSDDATKLIVGLPYWDSGTISGAGRAYVLNMPASASIADSEIIATFRFCYANRAVTLPYDVFEDVNSAKTVYAPRLEQTPTMTKKINDDLSGAPLRGTGTATLINTDGGLVETFSAYEPINGQVNIYMYEPTTLGVNNLLPVMSGILENYSVTESIVTLNLKDSIDYFGMPVTLDKYESGSGCSTDMVGKFKTRIFGRVDNLKAVSIDQEGTYSGAGTLNGYIGSRSILGTNTSFLSELSPEDELVFTLDYQQYTLTVENIYSDTQLTVSSPILSSFNGMTYTVIHKTAYPGKNRLFQVAAKPLYERALTVVQQLNSTEIELSDISDLNPGDELVFDFGETSQFLMTIYDVRAASVVFTVALPRRILTSETVYKLPVQNVTYLGNQVSADAYTVINNSSVGCRIQLSSDFELKAAATAEQVGLLPVSLSDTRTVAVQSNTGLETTFTNPNANDWVNSSVLLSDGSIVVGGLFTSLYGFSINRLTMIAGETYDEANFRSALGTGFNLGVNSLAVQADDKIIVGGVFTSLNGVSRPYLTRLLPTGMEDGDFLTNIGTGPDATVSGVFVLSDGKILVGGNFTSFNGTSCSKMVCLNANGTINTAFMTNLGTGFSSNVICFAEQADGKILVGGHFWSLNGTTCNRLVRLTSTGTIDTTFLTNLGTGFDSTVFTLAIINPVDAGANQIAVGGNFDHFNGVDRAKFTVLNHNGTEADGWIDNLGTGFNNWVNAIVVQTDDKIVVGGAFTTLDGTATLRMARFLADGTVDRTYSELNDSVTTMTYQPADAKIVVGGQFTLYGAVARGYLLRLETAEPFTKPLNELVKTRDWVSIEGSDEWREVLGVYDYSLTVRTEFTAGLEGKLLRRRATPVNNTSTILCSVYGETVNGTTNGALCDTAAKLFYKLLVESGTPTSTIDTDSFDVDGPMLSLMLPIDQTVIAAPTILSVAQAVLPSYSGLIHINNAQKITYSELAGAIDFDALQTISDYSVISEIPNIDSSKLISTVIGKYNSFYRDPTTAVVTPNSYSWSSSYASKFIKNNTILEKTIYLYALDDIKTAVQRMSFFLSQKGTTWKIVGPISLYNYELGEMVRLELRSDVGWKKMALGKIMSIQHAANGRHTLTISTLNSALIRQLRITPDAATDYSDSTLLSVYGYVTGDDELIDNQEITYNKNLLF